MPEGTGRGIGCAHVRCQKVKIFDHGQQLSLVIIHIKIHVEGAALTTGCPNNILHRKLKFSVRNNILKNPIFSVKSCWAIRSINGPSVSDIKHTFCFVRPTTAAASEAAYIQNVQNISPLKLVKVMKNRISQLLGLIGLGGPSIGPIFSSSLNVIRVINNALRFAKTPRLERRS